MVISAKKQMLKKAIKSKSKVMIAKIKASIKMHGLKIKGAMKSLAKIKAKIDKKNTLKMIGKSPYGSKLKAQAHIKFAKKTIIHIKKIVIRHKIIIKTARRLTRVYKH